MKSALETGGGEHGLYKACGYFGDLKLEECPGDSGTGHDYTPVSEWWQREKDAMEAAFLSQVIIVHYILSHHLDT